MSGDVVIGDRNTNKQIRDYFLIHCVVYFGLSHFYWAILLHNSIQGGKVNSMKRRKWMIKFHFVLFIFLLTKLLHCYFNVFNLGQGLPDSKWTFLE